ncbi:MAG: hypothetical protein LJE83_15025 [Gammaproteobacteria bacterium]|nr:hypothetical protein [Gammaproteobacteria bacterium]
MKFKSKIFTLAALAFSTSLNAATITNGSFEDDASTGYFIPTGWSWTGPGTPQILNLLTPSGKDGTYYVEAGDTGNPTYGTLSQTVTDLITGHNYELSFLWGNRYTGVGNEAYDFTVEMGGIIFSQSGTGALDFAPGAFNFIASASAHDLNITWNDPGVNAYSDGALDAFVLSDLTVPLPAAVWLFGSGIIGLLGIARRKA